MARATSPDPDWLGGRPHLDEKQSVSLLAERKKLIQQMYGHGEVEGLRLDRTLKFSAIRHGIATLPEDDDLYTDSRVTGDRRYRAEGVAFVRCAIRKEKEARRKPWKDRLLWVTAGAGLITATRCPCQSLFRSPVFAVGAGLQGRKVRLRYRNTGFETTRRLAYGSTVNLGGSPRSESVCAIADWRKNSETVSSRLRE